MGGSVIGVISETHGLLRPQVLPVFKGVQMILHAGDIGNPEVLEGLRTIAPVTAVRGNNDRGEWANAIAEFEVAKLGSVAIYMLHDVKELDPAVLPGFQIVVSGHSHRPSVDRRDGVLFLHAGSAGPGRFKLPISVARLTIQGSSIRAKSIELMP